MILGTLSRKRGAKRSQETLRRFATCAREGEQGPVSFVVDLRRGKGWFPSVTHLHNA